MTQPNDGGPAFPRAGSDYVKAQEGMTLRDWFAGQVLQGLASDREYYWDHTNEEIATASYNMADAMLKARSANV